MQRPDPSEHDPDYGLYVNPVDDGDVREILERGVAATVALLRRVPPAWARLSCVTALSIASLFAPPPLGAQVRGEDAVVRPVRVEEAPKIDGRLSEALWTRIEPITDFRQYEPDNGAPATEKTEVRICYDSRFLYFGIRAHDGEPDKIIARSFERDANVDNDDSFTVGIDSLNNNRTAVAFATNVLGTKYDVQYSEAGAFNRSWDGIWYAKGHVDEQGYTLEIAIPFFALRFKPAAEVEMGLDLERIIRRKSEKVNWPYLSRDHGFLTVSQYGRMVGLKGIERGVDLEIKPYGIGGRSESPGETSDEADAGLDVKWGVTPNFTVDATLNPDFAQVENDALRVNLDRFSLFFPEKRDFFIESADLFQFGLPETAEVFFSRRIGLRDEDGMTVEVPLVGGVRGYGRLGRTNLGLMGIRSDTSGGGAGETFAVARFKHEILKRSYLGAIVTSRTGEEATQDTTVGGDFLFLFGTSFKIQGAAARSDRPGVDGGNTLATAGVSQTTDLYDWTVRYDDIGENFDPGIGFVRRPDQRSLLMNAHYKPRPDIKGVRQLTFGTMARRIENHDGVLASRTVRPGFLAVFQTEDSFLAFYYDTFERIDHPFRVGGVTIPAGEYDNRTGFMEFSMNPARRFSLNASLSGGSFFGGDIFSGELGLAFKPIPRLHLSVRHQSDGVELPGG
ncbi:MAG: carbohydrate binding family 9 domain-containing protein, partial [bacterium]|nr:carbohydrate binding family 9 domain-containing protein [bacterium]